MSEKAPEKTKKYVLLHGSLKLSKTETLVVGQKADLLPSFVAQVDPSGHAFVSEEHFAALVDKVVATKKAEKLVAEKAADLKTAQEKIQSLRANAKQLAAVEATLALAPAVKQLAAVEATLALAPAVKEEVKK